MSGWGFDGVALVAIGGLVQAGVETRASSEPRRALALAAACAALAVALLSPVAHLASGLDFGARALQRTLLVLVVPPLALLSLPGGSPPVRVPAFAGWLAGLGALALTLAPPLGDAVSEDVMEGRLLELALLALGSAFAWPLRASSRLAPGARLGYVLSAAAACAALGAIVMRQAAPPWSTFAHPRDPIASLPETRAAWGLTASADRRLAGALVALLGGGACLAGALPALALRRRAARSTLQPR